MSKPGDPNEIKQITPAQEGWVLHWEAKKGSRMEGEPWDDPVICWALIHEEDGDRVIPISREDATNNFDGQFSIDTGGDWIVTLQRKSRKELEEED